MVGVGDARSCARVVARGRVWRCVSACVLVRSPLSRVSDWRAASPSPRSPVSQPQRFPCRYLVAWQLLKTMWRRNNKLNFEHIDSFPIFFVSRLLEWCTPVSSCIFARIVVGAWAVNRLGRNVNKQTVVSFAWYLAVNCFVKDFSHTHSEHHSIWSHSFYSR